MLIANTISLLCCKFPNPARTRKLHLDREFEQKLSPNNYTKMVEIINIESHQLKKKCNIDSTIDDVLNTNNIFRLGAFSYTLGHCIFNAIEVIFHFHFSSIKL